MEKSRVITILGFLSVCVILVALFYLMGRDKSEVPVPPITQTPPMKEQPTELNIEVEREGQGSSIINGQTAFVYYRGSLDDGKVFDQNQSGEGFSFLLGAGQVIQGWDLGVIGMKVGEKRQLTIPATLGYGASGFPGVIPPNATLHFEVELRGIR
jgi:FKBP-type peptidyl-prolyl cis-trans isomerase